MTGTAEYPSGPTTTCPRGHLVRMAEVASRDGMLVCPVCDQTAPPAADDLWRRPGAAPAEAPASGPSAAGDGTADQATGDAIFARPGSSPAAGAGAAPDH